MDLVEWSAKEAASLLPPLGNRWLPVQGVVERARYISHLLNEDEQAYLIAAAYLHDIGYAPSFTQNRLSSYQWSIIFAIS